MSTSLLVAGLMLSLGAVVQGMAQHLDALDDGFRAYDDPGPHAGQQRVNRDDVGCAAYERKQQIKGQFRQLDDFVASHDELLPLIDDEVTDSPYVTPRLRRRVHAFPRGSPPLATILARRLRVRRPTNSDPLPPSKKVFQGSNIGGGLAVATPVPPPVFLRPPPGHFPDLPRSIHRSRRFGVTVRSAD